MSLSNTIARLKAEKDEAFEAYVEKATELHNAYWQQVQEILPQVIEKMAEKYPETTASAERTEWTGNVVHWINISFPENPSFEWTDEVLDFLLENFPNPQGFGFAFNMYPTYT